MRSLVDMREIFNGWDDVVGLRYVFAAWSNATAGCYDYSTWRQRTLEGPRLRVLFPKAPRLVRQHREGGLSLRAAI